MILGLTVQITTIDRQCDGNALICTVRRPNPGDRGIQNSSIILPALVRLCLGWRIVQHPHAVRSMKPEPWVRSALEKTLPAHRCGARTAGLPHDAIGRLVPDLN